MTRQVLVVEDDGELQDLYAAMLQDCDCNLIRAHDGGEALKVLQEMVPDLVVLDILLDEIMGDIVFNHVRQDDQLKHIPVIVASVLSPDRCEKLLTMDSNTQCLRKPFRRQQLRDAVGKALSFSESSVTESDLTYCA